MLYIDIFRRVLKPVRQKYRKNADTNFRYENLPSNFKADIDVDEFGFVTFYPTLFEQIKIVQT